MMRAAWLLVLAACGAKPAAQEPPEAPVARETKFQVELVVSTRSSVSVEGIVRELETKEPMPNTTIALTSPALEGVQSAITDDNGHFVFGELPRGEYLLAAYNFNRSTEGTIKIETGKLVKVTIDWAASDR